MKQEKFIEVYDDLIPPQLMDRIEQRALYEIDYKYLSNITHPDFKEYNPGFARPFLRKEFNLYENVHSNFSQILYRLCSFREIDLIEILIGRVFLHLPSQNASPNNIHVDRLDPHWVCLYYLTDSDGDTILYEDDEITEIKRVSPKKGRIVFFDGSIKHCSSSPTTNHRAIINFDFIGEFLDKQK